MTTDGPTRTCVGCGVEDRPEAFERFVWTEATGLLHDARRKGGKELGRGAYVHASADCLARAAKSGFRRSFKAAVQAPTAEELVEQVVQVIRVRLDEAMRVAARSGAAGFGAREAEEQMKANTAEVVFVARDAGAATMKKYVANAERKRLKIVTAFDAATIGAWSGRKFVAVMTIGGPVAERAFREVQNLVRLDRIEG